MPCKLYIKLILYEYYSKFVYNTMSQNIMYLNYYLNCDCIFNSVI